MRFFNFEAIFSPCCSIPFPPLGGKGRDGGRKIREDKKSPGYLFFVIRGFGCMVLPESFQEFRLKNLI
jgi:hypothetical protein